MCSAASPGPSISKTDAVLIIDLDETLLSINSFPVWAAYFLRGRFEKASFKQRALLWLKSASVFAERKILGRSHAHTKNKLQELWRQADDDRALQNIIESLSREIRPNMRGLLELIVRGEIDAVLASAAASLYVQPFAAHIGFTHVLATGIGEEENRSEEKSRRVLEYLKDKGWENRKKIFFTDHLEDMPFILKSDKLMWLGKESELSDIRKSAPNLEIIACKNLEAQEILEAIKL
jgi:phosphoserine phosphatase